MKYSVEASPVARRGVAAELRDVQPVSKAIDADGIKKERRCCKIDADKANAS